MFKQLFEAVKQIAGQPEKLHVIEQPRRIQSDEERAAA